MAYDGTIPALSNLISNDIPAMQENFSLLESAQVVDEGSTADGDYIRYENGIQMCWHIVTIDYTSGDLLRNGWNLPVNFNERPYVTATWTKFNLSGVVSYTLAPSENTLTGVFIAGVPTLATNEVALGIRSTETFGTGDYILAFAKAIGRWK